MWYEGLLHTTSRFVGVMREDRYWFEITWSFAEEERRGRGSLPSYYTLGMNLLQPMDGENSDAMRLNIQNPFQSVVDFLSLIFGKVFIFDGITKSGDLRHLVIPSHAPSRLSQHPCRNSSPRVDFPLNTNIVACRDLLHEYFLMLQERNSNKNSFLAATRFYAQGVRDYDTDSVGAFLAFVSAVECLIGAMSFTEDEIHDDELARHLKRVSVGLSEDEAQETVGYIENRMFRVARKFRAVFVRYMDDEFFQRHDKGVDVQSSLPQTKITAAAKKIYSLRSEFLHEGSIALPEYLSIHQAPLWETSPIRDKHLSLDRNTGLPTLLFIERAVRYILLRYMMQELKA